MNHKFGIALAGLTLGAAAFAQEGFLDSVGSNKNRAVGHNVPDHRFPGRSSF